MSQRFAPPDFPSSISRAVCGLRLGICTPADAGGRGVGCKSISTPCSPARRNLVPRRNHARMRQPRVVFPYGLHIPMITNDRLSMRRPPMVKSYRRLWTDGLGMRSLVCVFLNIGSGFCMPASLHPAGASIRVPLRLSASQDHPSQRWEGKF